MDSALARQTSRLGRRAALALGLWLLAGVLAVFAQWAWAQSGAATALIVAALAVATVAGRFAARSSSDWLLVGLALALAAATGALVWSLGGDGLALVPQAAGAVVFAWLAWLALAALLVWGVRGPQALALVTSSAMSLWGALSLWFPLNLGEQPPYHFEVGATVADPARGYRVRPFSRARQYYPSDPRGYFDYDPAAPASPWRAWQLAFTVENAGFGDWTLLDPRRAVARIVPSPALPDAPWSCQWILRELPLPAGVSGEVEFEARADARRPLEWKLFAAESRQEQSLAQADFQITTEWQTFRAAWLAPSRPIVATCYFNLAASDVPLQFRRCSFRAGTQSILPPRRVTPYFLEYRFNAQGFRERQVTIPKPPNVIRLLCLGDSLIYGQGVRPEDTFSRQLEDRLNRGPTGERRYEVLNCGLSGYSPAEERACLEDVAPLYEPRMVILGLFVNDDEPLIEAGAGAQQPALPQQFAGPASRDVGFVRGREHLARLVDYCRERDLTLVAMLFRYGDWGADWQLLRDRLCGLLDERGIPWLDVGPGLLSRHSTEELMVHPRDGHPNEMAHRLAAEQMAEFLRARRLLPP